MPEILIHDRQGTVSVRESAKLTLLDKFWVELEMEDGSVVTTCQTGLEFDSGKWTCHLLNSRLRLYLDIRNIGNPRGFVIGVRIRNQSGSDIGVRRVSLVKSRIPRSSRVLGSPAGWRVLKMGYAGGGAHKEDEDGRLSALMELSGAGRRIRSWGVCAIKPAGIEGGLVIGFTTSMRQMAWIDIENENGEVGLSAVCETEGRLIAPGAVMDSEVLYAGYHENLAAGLKSYAELCRREMDVSLKPVPTGWCSLNSLGRKGVTQEKVLENARFISERRRKLPLDVIQLDDGYVRAYGDWLVPNEKFPDGLEQLAHGIEGLGLVPGIWVAPFTVSPASQLAREHPEWLLQDHAGNPLSWEVPWADQPDPWYALDGGNAEARTWLTELFGRLRSFGYRYFKLDFLFMGVLKGSHPAGLTRVEAYREAMQAIRKGAGDAYLLGCMAPYPPSVGVVDGMRVSGDAVSMDDFQTASREAHHRFFAHRSFWNNDPGAIVAREIDGASLDCARAGAASAVLSGGALFSGDPLPELPADRLTVLSDALEAGGRNPATPLDLFERESPRVFAQRLGGRKCRLGVFNGDGFARSVSIDLRGLGVAKGRVVLAGGSGFRKLGKAGKVLVTPPIPAHGAIMMMIEETAAENAGAAAAKTRQGTRTIRRKNSKQEARNR